MGVQWNETNETRIPTECSECKDQWWFSERHWKVQKGSSKSSDHRKWLTITLQSMNSDDSDDSLLMGSPNQIALWNMGRMKEWMCNTAREIEATTQPLCQSGWTRMKGVQPCKGIVFSCVLYCFIYSFNCLQLSPFFIFLVNLFVFVCWPGTCSQPRTRTLLKSQKGRPSAERSASRDSMKDDSFAVRIRILRNRTDIPRAIHVFVGHRTGPGTDQIFGFRVATQVHKST